MTPNISHDRTYVYYIDDKGRHMVLTKSEFAADTAAKQLDCKPCTVKFIGNLYELEKLK